MGRRKNEFGVLKKAVMVSENEIEKCRHMKKDILVAIGGKRVNPHSFAQPILEQFQDMPGQQPEQVDQEATQVTTLDALLQLCGQAECGTWNEFMDDGAEWSKLSEGSYSDVYSRLIDGENEVIKISTFFDPAEETKKKAGKGKKGRKSGPMFGHNRVDAVAPEVAIAKALTSLNVTDYSLLRDVGTYACSGFVRLISARVVKVDDLFDIIEDPRKTHHNLNKFLKGEGEGVDINEKIDGETALHVAVLKRDDADVVECLLKHKADKDAMDDYGRTPLMIAVTQKQESSVKVLLKHKAKTDLKDPIGNDTILGSAVSSGHTNIVKLLLNHGVDYVNARSFTGLPMLHFAAMSGNAGMIEALLEYEAKTNKTPSINTPARYQRALWVIGFPVQWAVYDGRVEAVKVLLKYDHGALKKIEKDEFYEDGSTLLLLAAVMGQVEVVKVLVELYGANVELKGKPPVGKTSVWNNTPVKIAEGTKNSPRHKDTVQYLESKIKEKQGKKGAQ